MKTKLKTLMLIAVLSISTAGSAWAADVMLYVTRHGKTMFNTVHRAQGWADTPLTASGAAVAEQLGRGLQPLPFVAAWSSDSGRARETAQLVMKNWKNPPVLKELKGLRESLNNASVTLLRYTDNGQFKIESINDMRYVERGL